MYQVRSRPKDQSSDEEEDGNADINANSISAINQNNDHQLQSVSVDIDTKNVSDPHSDETEKKTASDFTMFKGDGTQCGKDKGKGIVAQCDALQRLGAALSVYSEMNHNHCKDDDDEIESEDLMFFEFIGSNYRLQFIEDFNHLMEEHQDSTEEMKQEMIDRYGLKQCNAMDCEVTSRHFGGRRDEQHGHTQSKDVRSVFYRQKFDSLHFHIFHLEESGYRYRSQFLSKSTNDDNVNDDIDDEGDNEKAIDPELKEAVLTINKSKKKCDYGRFQGDGPNKFTMSVSGMDILSSSIVPLPSLRVLSTFSKNVDRTNGRIRTVSGYSRESHRESTEVASSRRLRL